MTKLQSLQPIIELNEFLKFIDKHNSYSPQLNKEIENILAMWSNTMPNIYSDPPCKVFFIHLFIYFLVFITLNKL